MFVSNDITTPFCSGFVILLSIPSSPTYELSMRLWRLISRMNGLGVGGAVWLDGGHPGVGDSGMGVWDIEWGCWWDCQG